jgi:conjugative relaxase-like TrwC/TraI family protein
LVRHQTAREYVNAQGDTVRTMEHRAGWDATFSAPKSVSLTALVGGDDRVKEAHRESVRTALDEMEKYAQARIGGNVTGRDDGRMGGGQVRARQQPPVDGYAAPQLHTHAVIFNMTETADGNTRALQPQELYKTQQYATAVYRSELAARLQELGLRDRARRAWTAGDQGLHARVSGGVESAASADHRAHGGGRVCAGLAAAQIAAHKTRDAKQPLSPKRCRRSIEQTGRRAWPSTAARDRERRSGPVWSLKPEQSRQRGAEARELCARARHGARGRGR